MNFKEYNEIIKKHKNDVNIFNTWDLLGVCYE